MKLLCVINNFDSGGAQRQMVGLACGLKARGHQVEIFIYYPQPEYSFFRPQIDQAGIPVHEITKGKGFSLKVLWNLLQLLRRGQYDGVISFLDTPNAYAEIARLGAFNTPVIVSERNSSYLHKGYPWGRSVQSVLHLLASEATTNNHTHGHWLRRYPWLRKKVTVIYNGLPLFDNPTPLTPPTKPEELRLLAIGRVIVTKNALNLVKALKIFHQRHGFTPKIQWAGKRDNSSSGQAHCDQVDALLATYPEVQVNWEWLGERRDIPDLLTQNHALIHPSLDEGLPNVICESLAWGRPVLASNVCDHPLLVQDGERGFLFDPHNPDEIAQAIEKLLYLSISDWQRLSHNARRYAEKNLGMDAMVEKYESLLYSYSRKNSAH